MRRFPVVVILGDGIGPELTEVTIDVLQAVEKRTLADGAIVLCPDGTVTAGTRAAGRAVVERLS